MPNAGFDAQATDRRDVDDVAAMFCHALLPGLLRPDKRPSQIDVIGLVQTGKINLNHLAHIGIRSSVVHQNI